MIKKYKIFEEYFDNDPLRVLGKTIVFENLGEALIISKILRDNGYTIFGHGAIHYSVRVGGCIAFTPLDNGWSRTHGNNFQLSTIRDVERGIGYLSFNDIVKRELLFNGKKPVEKDSTQGRIRWYKNGKLDEAKIIDIQDIVSEYLDDEGELLNMGDYENHLKSLFLNKRCEFVNIRSMTISGIVSDIESKIIRGEHYDTFYVGNSPHILHNDFEVVVFDEDIKPPITRWYKNGKLDESQKFNIHLDIGSEYLDDCGECLLG